MKNSKVFMKDSDGLSSAFFISKQTQINLFSNRQNFFYKIEKKQFCSTISCFALLSVCMYRAYGSLLLFYFKNNGLKSAVTICFDATHLHTLFSSFIQRMVISPICTEAMLLSSIHATGNSIINSVPSPSLLFTFISPPCAFTIS